MRAIGVVLALLCTLIAPGCGSEPDLVKVLLSDVPAEARRLSLVGQRGAMVTSTLDFSLSSLLRGQRDVSVLLDLGAFKEELNLVAQVYGPVLAQEDCLLGLGQALLPAGERSVTLRITPVVGCPLRGGDAPRLLRASAAVTRTLAGVTRTSETSRLPADQDHQVTLLGHGFLPGAALLIGDSPAADAVLTYDAESLRSQPEAASARFTFRLPKGTGALGKRVRLRVRNPDGREGSADDLLSFYESRVSFKLVEAVQPQPEPYRPFFSGPDFVGDDGLPDVLSINSRGWRAWRNRSSGERVVFEEQPEPLPAPPGKVGFNEVRSLLFAHLDGNRQLDLIVGQGDRTDAMNTGLVGSRLGVLRDVGVGTSWSLTEAPLNQDNFYNLLHAADFDGDGRVDLVSVGPTKDKRNLLRFFQGGGDGSFPEATPSTCALEPAVLYAGSDGGSHLAFNAVVGDVDGDQRPDVVVGYYNTSAGLFSVVRSASGRCGGMLSYQFVDESDRDLSQGAVPALGDVDGDGAPDLFLTSNDRVTTVRVLRNDGRGVFAVQPGAVNATRIATGKYQQQALSGLPGDVNGDGLADLMLFFREGAENKVLVYLNKDGTLPRSPDGLPPADAVFPVPRTISIIGTQPAVGRPTLVDVNGDGRLDVLFRGSDKDYRSYIQVLLNQPWQEAP